MLDKKYFIKLIDDATKESLIKEQVAPTKGGWDPIFRKRIDSKMQVSRAWKSTVQSIIDKARFFGIDLSKEYSAAALDEE
jgi:hypothetical protein